MMETTNVFSDYQQKKQKIRELAKKAVDFGWIADKEAKEINDKLDNDLLTIGVIGQMKAGKSTFLNSFVFNDRVLPSATTPMTAALSVITYGPEKKVEAEFYSADEWAEQKTTASMDESQYEGDELTKSKIKAAKELVEKAVKLGSSLNSLLGTTKNDTLDNLIEYVGADGKYVSITKSVKIYYPMEELKGVEIVDTPGFNDPIVSREQRTKEFLKRADAVVMLLYSGRPLDSTDRNIIFKDVKQCGSGRVLIAVNKYDMSIKEMDEEGISNYVKEELKKACREMGDDEFNQILKETTPIPISAEMGLLSELPMQTVSNDEVLKFAWNRHCDTFGITSQAEMRQYSHIDNLIKAICDVINNEKGKILFQKPINRILGEGKKKLEEEEKKIADASNMIITLNKPDDELDEMIDNALKAERRVQKKVDLLEDDLTALFNEKAKKGKQELEDVADDEMNNISDKILGKMNCFSSNASLVRRCNAIYETLVRKKLPRVASNILAKTRKDVKSGYIEEFLSNLNELCERYIEDFEYRDFLKSLQRDIEGECDKIEIDANWNANIDTDDIDGWDKIFDTSGEEERLIGMYRSKINDIDFENFESEMQNSCDSIIESVSSVMSELIVPIREQVEKAKTLKSNKESELAKAEQQKKEAEERKATLTEQIREVEVFKADI